MAGASSPSWDPGAYARFADERSRPFADLLARVGASDPREVVDLGCGSGELTAGLARRWPGARVVGVDSSPAMLEAADRHALPGRLAFRRGDVRDWRPAAAPDVVVCNAVLQWVPGALDLLRRWAGGLAPGGWLAVQVPGNHGAPSHELLRETARDPRFATRLRGRLRGPDAVADLAAHVDALAAAGCAVDAWETTYLHVLTGEDPVLRWVAGTALRPVLDALPEEAERAAFLAAYGQRLRAAYPSRPWGTPFPFRRLFVVAHREPGAGVRP